MKMLPKKKQNYIFIKIVFYLLIFISIIYTMRYTRTSNFSESIGIFFGVTPASLEQKSQWCPEGVQLVAWAEKDIFTANKVEINSLCSFASTGYESEEVKNLTWKTLLVAKNAQGNEEALESDPTLRFFKNKNLIYKSPQFKAQLEKVFAQK
jgi:hypothetical protein